MKKSENKRRSFFELIFLVSFLYYVGIIALSIYFCFRGIDTGWAMPAMSSHKLTYGYEAFLHGIFIGILLTIRVFLFIPVYQIVYVIYKKKNKKEV